MSYRIDLSRPLAEEVQRIAGEEIDGIARLLEAAPDGRQRSLHNARKGLKRLRGLLKLLRYCDPAFHDRENVRLRDMARNLSGVRDADALVETAERFLAAAPGADMADHIAATRDRLASRRDRIVGEMQSDRIMTLTATQLRQARQAFETIDLPAGRQESARLLARGAKAMITKAQEALKQARKEGTAENFHELRKALKYHRMHLSLLGDGWPGGSASRQRKAEALGEKLGELNDIHILRAALDAEERESAASTDLAAFRGHLAATEKTLRKACLRQAADLLDGGGKRLTVRIGQKMRKAA